MYFDLFTGLNKSPSPGWEAVPKLGEIQRGDIIAWELAASTEKPGDTGHVVIVAAAPADASKLLLRVLKVGLFQADRHATDSKVRDHLVWYCRLQNFVRPFRSRRLPNHSTVRRRVSLLRLQDALLS